MRRVASLVCLVLLATIGCSNSPTSTLSPGMEAIIVGNNGEMVWTNTPKTKGFVSTPPDTGVPSGTKVRVVEDAGDSALDFRDVVVLVLEGKLEGFTRSVPRKTLKPVP